MWKPKPIFSLNNGAIIRKRNDTKLTIVTIKDRRPASFVSDLSRFSRPDDIKFNDGNKFYDVAAQINIKKLCHSQLPYDDDFNHIPGKDGNGKSKMQIEINN